jgi:group II intron reverse transcriptase/maturase
MKLSVKNWNGQRRLYSQVYTDDNLTETWHKVRKNSDAPGIDGVTIPLFERRLFSNLKALQQELKKRRYHPQPVKQISIPKANGQLRSLGILTVRDRVVQRAVLQVIEPLFEPHFSDCSFAFRPDRSVQMAVQQVANLRQQGNGWAVDLDIQAYFDHINLEKLLALVQEKLKDKHLLRMIREWLYINTIRVFHNGSRQEERRTRGIVQGATISPLLANIYLDQFDKEALKRGLQIIRYADDILILCQTSAEAKQALNSAREILTQLDLTINPQKTQIVPVDRGLRFLGEELRHWLEHASNAPPHSEGPAMLTVTSRPRPGLDSGDGLIDWTHLLGR